MNEPSKDNLSALEGLIPTLVSAVDRVALGEGLSVAIEGLKNSSDQLRRFDALADFVPIVRKHVDDRVIGAAISSIEKFGRTLVKAKTSEELKSISFALSPALTNIQTLEAELRRGWDAHVMKRIGPTDRLGKVLSQINEMKEVGKELIAISAKARALAQTVDDAKQQSISLEKLAKSAENEKNKATVGDKIVDNFLALLADEKATLLDVTPAVLAWIKKVGALKQLSVRI